MAAQTFLRWSRLGMWEHLLGLAQENGVPPGGTFLDGASIRAHQKAAGVAKKGRLRRDGTRASWHPAKLTNCPRPLPY